MFQPYQIKKTNIYTYFAKHPLKTRVDNVLILDFPQ